MPFNIYYLDDEPELLEVFVDCFSSPEIAISTFSDPAEVIKITHQNPPDLLILDYRLPNTTGDEVALVLPPEIPKIMITGDLEVHPKSHFLSIFRKPFDVGEIQDFILGQAQRKMSPQA